MLQTSANLGTNLVYLGLAKIIVAQDETGSLFFKDDVEVNPGSYRKPNEALSICHWNSNNISIHTFTNLLKAYVKFDIICLSETYLDSSSPFDDNTLHPNQTGLSIQEPTLHNIHAVTIKLFTQNVILKSKIQMMILSEEQLISSTGKKLLKIKMWMRKS